MSQAGLRAVTVEDDLESLIFQPPPPECCDARLRHPWIKAGAPNIQLPMIYVSIPMTALDSI